MKESGFYLLKEEYITMVNHVGGKYLDSKERPIYCCIRDNLIDGLYWAIPTSDIAHRTQVQMLKIEKYCNLPLNDIRSCYYHIGETNRPAVFKISNALPITESYVEKEYMSQGQQLHIQNNALKAILRKKLLKILSYENLFPNRLEQHITDIKTFLCAELQLSEKTEPIPSPVPPEKKPSIHDRIERAEEEIAQRAAEHPAVARPTHDIKPHR